MDCSGPRRQTSDDPEGLNLTSDELEEIARAIGFTDEKFGPNLKDRSPDTWNI